MSSTPAKGDSVTLVERTCDQCAAPGRCVIQGDAYICEVCVGFHERALRAAHEAAWGELPSWAQERFGTYEEPERRWERIVAAVVKGYCEFTDEPTNGSTS